MLWSNTIKTLCNCLIDCNLLLLDESNADGRTCAGSKKCLVSRECAANELKWVTNVVRAKTTRTIIRRIIKPHTARLRMSKSTRLCAIVFVYMWVDFYCCFLLLFYSFSASHLIHIYLRAHSLFLFFLLIRWTQFEFWARSVFFSCDFICVHFSIRLLRPVATILAEI